MLVFAHTNLMEKEALLVVFTKRLKSKRFHTFDLDDRHQSSSSAVVFSEKKTGTVTRDRFDRWEGGGNLSRTRSLRERDLREYSPRHRSRYYVVIIIIRRPQRGPAFRYENIFRRRRLWRSGEKNGVGRKVKKDATLGHWNTCISIFVFFLLTHGSVKRRRDLGQGSPRRKSTLTCT